LIKIQLAVPGTVLNFKVYEQSKPQTSSAYKLGRFILGDVEN